MGSLSQIDSTSVKFERPLEPFRRVQFISREADEPSQVWDE
jgi:hypothetical protein